MLLLAALLSLLVSSASSISCKDQQDFDIPWYAGYKMPKNVLGDTVGSRYGIGFYYLDSSDRTQLKPSAVSINESHQAIGYTLNQYYANINDSNLLHVFYNDEPVNLTNLADEPKEVEWGHNKGVLIFDGPSGQGIWLVHSVPKFPHPLYWEYPVSGEEYGQSFLCVTVDTRTLAQLGTALYYNHAWVYHYNLPDWATQIAPDLAKIVKGVYASDPSQVSLRQPLTVVGTVPNPPTFEIFAKTHLLKNDLWQTLIAPAYGSMEVETWRRGHLIELNCSLPYPVYDAQTMQAGHTAEFKYTKDHSKFGRTLDQGTKVVCIGDINRMTSQYIRGGGAVCIKDNDLWNAWSVFKSLPSC